MIPSDLKYTPDHEWVREKGDRATVGITEYAQKELGDVVYVELPAIGEKVKAKTEMGSIESVKAVSDIYAPLSGEVLAVNEELQFNPELVNQDPYGKGWIAEIEITDREELKKLLSAEEYRKLIGE
ncbi:glycine cleavage system protein GcvH [Capillibacterium thermochitinicola]|uniref:Glycine cleavage system H protein n=1 Tax=Capillibacterium thermochitinicola TaxID=2699427 RepID=A0A8J6I0A4_9FIRM|nr:glycine cleavage system protein GcvH [Capillibacterium thermochitinicola]MBA2133091.1 glycine cleavage system protein GcvH [Capillibacterium thermochitinicola]